MIPNYMAFESFALQFSELGGHRVFGVPGGGPSLELITQVERRGGVFSATGHEAVAALMAGAYARQTGRLAACVSIKGPGFMNLAPGLLCNSYEGYPCLSISEAYPCRELTGRRHKWLQHRSVAGCFLRGMYGFSEDSSSVADIWRSATTECPGPVHMDLVPDYPEDIGAPPERQAPSPIAWRSIVAAARRPALLVGSWALRSHWSRRLSALRVPIFTTAAGKGALSENLPSCAGVCTGDGKPSTPEKRLLPHTDLLICLGVRSGEMLSASAPHGNAVWFDAPNLASRGVFPEDVLGLRATALTDVDAEELLEALAEKTWGMEETAAALRYMDESVVDWPDSPREAIRAVSQRLPGAAHIVDTGNFTVWVEHFLRVDRARDITGTPNGRYLGAGVGYALGTALARTPEPAVLWIGDGGIRANFAELALAVDHALPLLVIVMSDGYYGSIRSRARALGWSQRPLVLPNHRLVRAADTIGFATWKATSAVELDEAVAQWQRSGAPGLIEYQLDPDMYVDFTERLR